MGTSGFPACAAFAARVAGLFGPRKRDSDLDRRGAGALQLLVDRFVAQECRRGGRVGGGTTSVRKFHAVAEDRREVRTLGIIEDLGATYATPA